MCLLDVREDGGADGGAEIRGGGAGGGINRSLGDVWKNINMPVFIFVCMKGEVCFVSAVCLGVFFLLFLCLPVRSGNEKRGISGSVPVLHPPPFARPTASQPAAPGVAVTAPPTLSG